MKLEGIDVWYSFVFCVFFVVELVRDGVIDFG